MDTEENKVRQLLNVYEGLYVLLEDKREILTERRLDELGSLDEKIVSVYNQIQRMAQENDLKPTEGEREDIRVLADKIHRIESTNQAVITHSLTTINKIFDGVMRIVNANSTAYTNTGRASAKENLGLSSVVEEA